MHHAARRPIRSLANAIAFFALLLIAALARAAGPPPAVELLVRGGPELEEKGDPLLAAPAVSFELRFAEGMVAPEAAGGGAAAESPLVFTPALAGGFRWISPRVGIFTATEPPALSTTYRVALRLGMRLADGRESGTTLTRTFHTPPLEVRGFFAGYYRRQDAPTDPQVHLLANAALDPVRAAAFLRFQNAAGERVPAEARPAPADLWFPLRSGEDATARLTWRERFAPIAGPRTIMNWVVPIPAVGSKDNRLLVTPARPLPAGTGWKLVAAEGLPSREPGVRLLRTTETEIGDVQALGVSGVRAINDGDGARRLRVRFSQPLAAAVTAETLGRWLKVEPAPAGLKASFHPTYHYGETVEVELAGAFATNTDYRVTVEPGLPARRLLLELRERWTGSARFEPLPPRLRFPEFSVHQLVSGRRQFELRAVNVPAIRLRAKLFAPDAAGLALATYQKEYLAANHREDFERVDLDRVPGQTIYQATLPGSPAGGGDDARTLTLSWNDILGEGRRAGIVLLEAEQPAATAGGGNRRAGTQALVQLTDLGLVWKRARGGELLVYAFSLADARPADGATVRLLDAAGQPLAEARADADGVARLSAPGKAAAFLLAARGEDCHVAPLDDNHRDELALHRFRLPLDRSWDGEDGEENKNPSPAAASARPPRETLLFSDRQVYQPGETLHLKAIVRDWPRVGEPAAPAPGTAATLRAFDARGRKFWEKQAALGAAGSLAEDVALPKSGLGRYRLTIAFPDGSAPEPAASAVTDEESDGEEDGNGPDLPDVLRFQVQQYRPNPFEVKLAAPSDLPAAPGRVEVPLAARYFMGTPLTKAKVSWNLEARDTVFRPAGFERYTFNTGDLDSRLERNPGTVSLHGEAALGADGTLGLTPEIALNEAAPGPRAAELSATVTDLDQASVTARTKFTVHASGFYLGLRALPEVVREGEPLPVEAVAVRAADGRPLEKPVPVQAKLSRIEWQTSRPANASGGFDYRSEPHVELIKEQELATASVHRVGGEWLPATLSGAAPFTAGEPGEYLLELAARDEAGREVLTAATFNVLGGTEAAWSLRDVRRMDLVPDRAEYISGQTATILLKTPIAGRALVTVEREGVRRAFSVEVRKETPAVTVPLEAGDAPNVFVSVLLLRGADASPRRVPEPEFRVGYCQLTVARPESRLAVAVAAAREEYQPGEDVAAEVRVTDFQGKPVAGAEITLYAVDEGILSLTGYRTPDPLAAFFRRRPLGVRTGLTLPSLLPEDPDERDFSNKGYLVGGGGIELRGDRRRENFAACAAWNAALVTDSDGRARASFPAPDSLSRYRLMAVVHEGAGRFGSGEGAFRIRKPLMLEPALPRFGNVGDRLLLRAVLFNTSPTAGEVEVSLALDNKATLAGDARPVRRLALAAGETRAVDFPVEFVRTGRAEWTWRARLAGDDGTSVFQDSVRTTLDVGHPVPRRAEVLAFTVPANGRLDDLLGRADPALLGGEDATLEVSLANTRLGELREGIGALLHYPYGCVEQTTSSLLPWLGLRGVGGAEVLPELAQPRANAEEAVARGVNRLLSMQTEKGGLAYWPGGKEAHPWGSAYGGLGLALAKRAGFSVPAEPFKRVCDFLSQNLRSEAAPTGDQYHAHRETDRCLALLALAFAGRAEPAYHERLFAQRETLGVEDRALLALAIAESRGPAEMLDALLRPASGNEDADRAAPGDFSGRASVLGMRLLAWCRHRPDDPAVGTLLDALLRERRRGAWLTTQGNAWGLLALSGYVEAVERSAGSPVQGEIVLAGRRAPFALPGGAAAWSGEFPLPAAAGADARPPALSVSNPDAHPLFLQVKLSARPADGAPTAADSGFRVARRYERVTEDGRLAAADVAGGTLKVGDRVLVSLDVETPASAAYVVVDDPLPAILEAVNPEFKTSSPVAAMAVANADADPWISSFRELREDRAVFFCDRLYAGRYHLQYLARVRAAGSAAAPATKVEEMYHPERFGLGAAETLNSSPLD